ncbi:MAG TPA: formyltransferase family protein [bacterium]|nr:formyltransferase family protein [bacterium]HOL48667.1 formyltransferase family protein [bacterium]
MQYALLIGNEIFQKYIANELLKNNKPVCIIIENFDKIQIKNPNKIKTAYLYGKIKNLINRFYNDFNSKKFFNKYNSEIKKLFPINNEFKFSDIYFTNSINNNKVIEYLSKYKFDIIICIGTSIVKSELLNIYENKIFNLHTSILPHYRGVLAEFWALYYADYDNIGVSLHHLKRKLDSGDIVAQMQTEYNHKDTPAVLRFKNANTAINLICNFIKKDKFEIVRKNNIDNYYSKPTYIDIVNLQNAKKNYMECFEISLKKYPYLFKAAATITNDIDEENFDNFIETMKYFNTSLSTQIGNGLNLEIGNTFWFYHNKKSNLQQFTYFDGLTSNYSKYQPILLELLKSGHIDCLHTYGDFNNGGGFNLKLAEQAVNELLKQNINIKVWIGHGDKDNLQNYETFLEMGKPLEYDHYKYFKDIGIEFMWYGNSSIIDIIGQDRKVKLFEPYLKSTVGKYSKQSFQKKIIKNVISNFQKFTGLTLFDYIFNGNNNSIIPFTLHNGIQVYTFRRFGSWEDDQPFNLPNIINKYNLDKLVETEGVTFFYNHLGKRRTLEKNIFQTETIKCFELLKTYNLTNKIFITTTSRLLTYLKTRNNLKYKSYWKNGCIYIEILNTNLSKQELEGITFYTPYPFKTFIFYNNQKLILENNSEDHTGKKSVTVKWNKIVFPNL